MHLTLNFINFALSKNEINNKINKINMNISIKFNVTLVVWLTFIVLKLFNQLNWTWWCINIPFFIMVGLTIIAFILCNIFKYSDKKIEINL